MNKNIVLLGIKHSGKSTLGKHTSTALGFPFFDTDNEIFSLTGKTPREIFNAQGKPAFIQAEYQACDALLKNLKGQTAVIATGGGICDNAQALEVLKSNSIFIFLNVAEEVSLERILREVKFNGEEIADPSTLPAYINKKNPHTRNDVRTIFHDFYTERVAIYKSIADISIDLNKDSISANTTKIVEAVKGC